MEQQIGMSIGGWIFIAGAWSAIIATTIFCFKRVLSTHNQTK